MRSEFLSFSPPALSDLEKDEVLDVLRKDWLSSGPKTKQFEEKFKERVGAPAALALNSCTAGLHLAMVVHKVDENAEVITTPMTFCASANVVEHQRGNVVLADIDPETLLIDPREIEKKLTKKTKVICPVHYAGHPCDMEKINAIAKNHGAAVVEDAAHCMPSKIGSKWVGSSDNLTLFSFYATKNITTGEGGMMTGREDLVDEARILALHGMSRGAWDRFKKGGSWKYDVAQPGYKYNLPEMASALGLAQLSRLDELFAMRMKVVDFYEKAFAGSEYIVPLKNRAGFQSSRHLYVIQMNLDMFKINRDQFIDQMTERNIGTSVHYIPVHLMSYYAKKYGWKPESFPNAFRAYERMLSLPLSSRMSLQDADDVVRAVHDICAKFKR
ncbi:MAG: DegT/DnrJ/EryC1/StrS family aminotransferase [Bdellovibrionales bacterium]